jgi:ankyrin repeat protein
LVEAARQGNHAVLTALLASGAPTETRTSNNGQTALMQAALLYDETESLRLLLDAGALIDAQTESGQTALALAAHHENNEAVELLVQRGASTECRTPEGLTPLMIMAQLGYIHAMEGLLSKNASRDALAPDGRSAGDMVHDAYVQRANRRAQADEVHPNPCG